MTEAVTLDTLAVLKRVQPLTVLGNESLKELLPLCRRESCKRGKDPFVEHSWDGQIVYLTKGELLVNSPTGGKDVVVGGSGRGLLPIRRQGLQPVTKAITDVEVLAVDEDPVDVMVTWDQLAVPLVAEPQSSTSEAKDWRQMSGMFAVRNLTAGAFASLPPANIGSLLDRFAKCDVKRGEVIVRQGEEGDYYYLIERGRCKVSRQVGGAVLEVAELKEGDAFGEEALVADSLRNATVVMKTDGVLLRLAKGDFNTMLKEPLLQRISSQDAMKKVANGAVWVDVRFPAEFQQDRLDGAVNIPLNEIRAASMALDPQHEYVVYCQTGRRSSAVAFLLSQRGVRAWLLDGGLKALRDSMERQQ